MASQLNITLACNFISFLQLSNNEGKLLANHYCACSLSLSFSLLLFLLNADKAQFMKQIIAETLLNA